MSVEHRIDILVNNAGLLAKAPVVEAGVDHFRQVMETNFFGCLELIAAVTPQMIQRQTGGQRCSSSHGVLQMCTADVHSDASLWQFSFGGHKVALGCVQATAQAGMQAC